mgnify:CR=1 FL=1
MTMSKIIFLIDDDDTYNALNKRMLKKHLKDEYEIRAFTDAEEAIKQILEENVIPSHLFLDVNMPVMDGWEFLEILEEETEGTDVNINVSMLTSSMFPQDKAKALKSKYVHHYINKPLDPLSIHTIFGD